MRHFLALSFLSLLSTAALAQNSVDTSYQVIDRIKTFEDRVEVQISRATHTCNSNLQDHYRLRYEEGTRFELLSALLISGYMSLSEVSIMFQCEGGDARILGVRLQRN